MIKLLVFWKHKFRISLFWSISIFLLASDTSTKRYDRIDKICPKVPGTHVYRNSIRVPGNGKLEESVRTGTMRDNYVLIAGIVASVSFSSFKTRCKCSVCRAKCTVYVAFFPRCAGTKVGYVNACLHSSTPSGITFYLAKSVIYFFFLFLFFFFYACHRDKLIESAVTTTRSVSRFVLFRVHASMNRLENDITLQYFRLTRQACVRGENVRRARKKKDLWYFCYHWSVKTRKRMEEFIKIFSLRSYYKRVHDSFFFEWKI